MDTLTIVAFFEFFHPDQVYRFVSAGHDMEFNGETYTASGALITIGAITEEEGFRAQRIPVTLSLKGSDQGDNVVNTTFYNDLADERIRGAEVNIDVGFYDQSFNLVSSEPIWRGQLNGVNLSVEDASVTFDILSTRGITRRRTQYNFSDAHHREIYADDRVFEFQVTNFLTLIEANSGGSGTGTSGTGGGFSGSFGSFATR